jgi:hypothetical protein
VGGHTVELRFIAAAIVAHAFIEPEARLYGAVRACHVITVFFKEFSGFAGNKCHFLIRFYYPAL